MRITRRKFFGSLFAGVPCGIGYATSVEPKWIDVSQVTIRVAAAPLPKPVKLLHLSDFHLSRHVPFSLIENAVQLGVAEKPDLVCLTGDFVTGRLQQADEYAATLRKLAASAPAIAVLGNHDGGLWSQRHGGYETTTEIRDLLTAAGIRTLHNEATRQVIGPTSLQITGLGDLWAGEFKPADAFSAQTTAASHATILLSHNPDSKDDVKDFRWDLMLSGHTHGGQVSLPLVGGGVFAPVRDSRYIAGRYEWNGRQLYITRGIGSILGIRFNCRPEVSILTLV